MLIEIIGWLGSFMVILAYAMNIFKKISADSVSYYLLNIIGQCMPDSEYILSSCHSLGGCECHLDIDCFVRVVEKEGILKPPTGGGLYLLFSLCR